MGKRSLYRDGNTNKKHPCRDCPDRNAMCRVGCKALQAYTAEKEKLLAETAVERKAHKDIIGYKKDVKAAMLKRMPKRY